MNLTGWPRRTGLLLAPVALTLGLTSCGSRVGGDLSGVLSATAGEGVGAAGAATFGAEGQAPTSPTQAGSVGTDQGQAPGSYAVGSAGSSQGVGPSTPGLRNNSGRGFDAKTITVGVVTSSSTGKFASTFGVTGDTGDIGARFRTVAKYINSHGGVAGRQLVIVTHDVDFATAVNNPAQASAEVCTAFVQDRKVFAVLNPLPLQEQHQCLAKGDTPFVDGSTLHFSQQEFNTYSSYFFGPAMMTTERMIHSLISSIVGRKFFAGWNATKGGPGPMPLKIGLLYAENPQAAGQAKLQRMYLEQAGYKISDTVSYQSNLQAALAATQNAILKFKAEGITHVVGASVFFLQGAEQQNYRPRYVLPPSLGRSYAANSPKQQMVGSMTIGWRPLNDVAPAQLTGDLSPATTLCKKIMKADGHNVGNADEFAGMLKTCDAGFAFAAALQGVKRPSNLELRLGIERLGTVWRSAETYISRFSSSQHASAVGVRDVEFDPSCTCMKYTSGVRLALD